MLQCEDIKDDDRPSNTLEHFAELEAVLLMIDNLKGCTDPSFEKDFEHYTEILTRYQEQPHLLDAHIEELLSRLLAKIRNRSLPEPQLHAAFKFMYVICKVRTYKALVKFLPHELSDLEYALELLEHQDAKQFDNWETRYMLLCWMSILVLNPFHMSRLDVYGGASDAKNTVGAPTKSKMERIYELCQIYSSTNDTCSSVAAQLASKYFIRSDIKDLFLPQFFKWVMSQNQADTLDIKYGQLAAVAAILKHGKREDLLPHADDLLHWIIGCGYKKGEDFLAYKNFIKIVQRLGLVYLKPRLAGWRYKRGTRSLAHNLTDGALTDAVKSVHKAENLEEQEEEEVVVPEAIEEVIEELLQALRSGSSDIRWSAAKGVGRVTNRLSKELGDEVIGSVIDILSPLEPHEAWHGACLALAELAKRGLLLPHRLAPLVNLLTQALFYDEMKGYMSVGQHIRDAACYMCWAFARAYNPEDLQPFVQQISTGLLTVAVFDREINCRRAASAAFQESVGRLGNFPHGIDISTATDFYSVGLRQNTYLHISHFIAQYGEYCEPLIMHLVERKVGHWDLAIRELTAKALNRLTSRAPVFMAQTVLPLLFAKTDSIDIHQRHGSILSLGEITLGLRELEKSQPLDTPFLSAENIKELNELLGKLLRRDLFRGMSGEMMKQSCCDYIRNCSKAVIPASEECLSCWQLIIDKALINKASSIREAAAVAFAELCRSYYCCAEQIEENEHIVSSYMEGASNDLEEHVRMGYTNGLGVLPAFIVQAHFEDLLKNLVQHSLTPLQAIKAGVSAAPMVHENVQTTIWSEARRESVKALSNLVQTVGYSTDNNAATFGNEKHFNTVIDCLLRALEEYTLDNRGDIGAWVREAAMTALHQILISCPSHMLQADQVHNIMLGFAQQAVEKIDRTRGLAGRLFCNLVHAEPIVPHIKDHAKLKEIFPQNDEEVLWLFADHTFPLFCALLELPAYSQRVLLGLSASIGQLTESLIKYSANALFQFLRTHPSDVPRLCREIVANFEKNLLNERVTYPMLSFLEILIGSSTINDILMDANNNFADEIFRLLNLEIKGHKKLYKLVSSINVYCQLIQVPQLCKKILSKLAVFLGLTHVHVRKSTASKLCEALLLYGDCCDIPQEHLDDVMNLLTETDWGAPLIEVRPVRNEICKMLGIKPPVGNAPSTATLNLVGAANNEGNYSPSAKNTRVAT